MIRTLRIAAMTSLKKQAVSPNTLAAFKELSGTIALLFAVALLWSLGQQYWDERYYVAEEGLGYWMGIIGGVMMLFAMAYTYIKRAMKGERVAWIKKWFQLHILAGIFGPVIIVLHTTFQLGSINGMIAFYSMLVVFISGLVGRYIFSGLNRVTHPDQLQMFKKMMGRWRQIHVPLIYMLLFSGILHVVAVHLY